MRDYYNWENKEERATKAEEHTVLMEEKYYSEIGNSIKKSHIFRDSATAVEKIGTPSIKVVPTDSVSSAFSEEGRTVILNFASHKNPGGMFLKGSRAQEECLCHESFLYNVLKSFDETYYEENRKVLNKALYTNAAIYSEDIVFEHNSELKYIDVLTCACPNKKAAQKYQNVTDEENSRVLEERIKFVTDILSHDFKNKNIILGAFGCGVFGQNPTEVAELFKKYIDKLGDVNIVFAIPDDKSENYLAFKRVFGDN